MEKTFQASGMHSLKIPCPQLGQSADLESASTRAIFRNAPASPAKMLLPMIEAFCSIATSYMGQVLCQHSELAY